MSESKNQQAIIHETKEFQEKVVNFVLENDIRVIFYGDAHSKNDSDTQLPLSLVHTLCDSDKINLKAIYFEYTGGHSESDMEESKFFRDQVTINCRAANSFNEHKAYAPDEPKIMSILNYLYDRKQLNKVCAFGRNSHDSTIETLDNAIKEAASKEVIIISIGAGHLFQAVDSQNKYGRFFVSEGNEPKKRSGQYKQVTNIADATFLETYSKEENQIRYSYIPTTSLGLVDHFAGRYKAVGILAIDGLWRSAVSRKIQERDFFIEKRNFIITNRSVRELATRHQNSHNVFIAKNYNNWDAAYLSSFGSVTKKVSDNVADAKNDEEQNQKPNGVNRLILENFKTYDSYFALNFFVFQIDSHIEEFNEQLLPKQKKIIGKFINDVFFNFIPETDRYLKEKKHSDILSNLYFTSMSGNAPMTKDPVDIFLRFPPPLPNHQTIIKKNQAKNQGLLNDENDEGGKNDGSLGDHKSGMHDPHFAKKLALLQGDSDSDDNNDYEAVKAKPGKDNASPSPANPAAAADSEENEIAPEMDYIDLSSDEDD